MVLRQDNSVFEPRYSYGGDEFVLVEFDEAMSLEANLRVQSAAARVDESAIPGIIDVCPANVSYMVRYDPDRVSPEKLIGALKEAAGPSGDETIEPFATRVVDIPILFNDPWTREVLMRFRDRVQDPNKTDAEYLASVNGLDGPDSLVEALTSTAHLVTMTGFVPGTIWCFQLVDRDRQIQGPKYLRPRTETPDRAFAIGGAFTAIYASGGAGGYPILGRAAAPVYDRNRGIPDLRENGALVRVGDIYNYRSIDRDEYDLIGEEVAAGTFTYTQRNIEFEPAALFADPDGYSDSLVSVLYDPGATR